MWLGLSFVASRPQFINMPMQMDRNNPVVRSILRDMVLVLRASILLIFAFLVWQSVNVGLGHADSLPAWFLPLVLIQPLAILVFFGLRLLRLS
jgi:hypothetical protein